MINSELNNLSDLVLKQWKEECLYVMKVKNSNIKNALEEYSENKGLFSLPPPTSKRERKRETLEGITNRQLQMALNFKYSSIRNSLKET